MKHNKVIHFQHVRFDLNCILPRVWWPFPSTWEQACVLFKKHFVISQRTISFVWLWDVSVSRPGRSGLSSELKSLEEQVWCVHQGKAKPSLPRKSFLRVKATFLVENPSIWVCFTIFLFIRFILFLPKYNRSDILLSVQHVKMYVMLLCYWWC